MNIPAETRQQVRERANFACEYCGVTETDTGGELTVDHFRPRACGGGDDLDNLLYCCYRCNQYKVDYWPTEVDDPPLWNPRRERLADHMLLLADGTLQPTTATGEFTVKRLRLNRPALVALRLRKRVQYERRRLLMNYRDLLELLERLHRAYPPLLSDQSALLEEQQTLLRFMFRLLE